MRNKIIQIAMAALLTLPTAALAAVQLPATGQNACFDANGNPRACLGSGEDGEKQAGVGWPVPRLSDNGDGTVTDTLTKLIWSKDADAPDAAPGCANADQTMSWDQALAFVACLNANGFSGFSDWRLPNLNELESLVHAGVSDSAAWLNASGFTEVQSGLYWSSTNDNSDKNSSPPSMVNAWDVDLAAGGIPLTSAKTATRAVWPVRGTSSAPAQLWRTGEEKCFDTFGLRINPCTGTGQDGESLAGALWPVPRFQANGAATLATDNLTGLIWAAESNTPGPAACSNSGHPMTWQEALDHVKCLNQNAFLGLTDWRLPNRKELRSLADYAAGNPALPDFSPFTAELAKGNTFWTSTTSASGPKNAWTVSIFDGSVNAADKRNALLLVWPVSDPDLIAPALTLNAVSTLSRVTTQTVSGTVEAGVTPQVSLNGGLPTAATVTGTSWSVQISGLKAGANTITVTAADPVGNAATATATVTVVLPDGSFSGGPVSIADALKALRIAVGIVTPTAEERLHGDVAPLGAPDDRIDVSDALLILKKAVGLVSF